MELRGIVHVHSTHSYDGKLSLPELKKLCTDAGLQFACMTEHTDYLTPEFATAFVAECDELSDDSFVFIPGFEVPYGRAHVLHIGARTCISATADATQLQAWRAVAPLVVLAHPVRNEFLVDEPLLRVIDGVEVWNQQYDSKVGPRPRSVTLLHELRNTKSLIATGGLDLHREEHFGSPQVTLEAAVCNEASILSALSAGNFHFGSPERSYTATQTIDVRVLDHTASHLSVGIIAIGKRVSALLSQFGIKVPSWLRRLIRRRL